MNIRKAYDLALKKTHVEFGRQGHYFAWVGWRSPENGQKYGPYLVSVQGGEAIEVSRRGKFKDTYPATSRHYFPWIDEVEDV